MDDEFDAAISEIIRAALFCGLIIGGTIVTIITWIW